MTLLLVISYLKFRHLPEFFTVRVGSSSRRRGGSIIQVHRIIQHPKANHDNKDYDFALIELAEPISYSDTVRAIELPNENFAVADGTNALVSGWGEPISTFDLGI